MRELSSSDGTYESPYFEDYDADGDSYSLAWRYLGVYIDDDGYSRKVLWGAYYDPNYSGNQIGEYSYYNWEDGYWDDSTCTGDRCAKMDCHDLSSETWVLVGYYKDSLEFENDTFFEQLFKHQGVCLWGGDNDDYQFMQEMREEMDDYGSCYQAGNGIYIGAKPVEGGDLELAVYSDSYCQTEQSDYSVGDYVSSSSGYSWDNAFSKWNSMMDAYKVCQPCRAYSKSYNTQDSWRRQLYENYDGQGAEENNGFNCYDDAGYRNCNQCYKFETHTDMEEASDDDLELAISQGTIVSLEAEEAEEAEEGSQHSEDENRMESSYSYTNGYTSTMAASSMAVGLAVVLVGALLARYRCKRRIITTEGDLPLDHPVL